MHDVYADRRRQYATLIALGVSPARVALAGLSLRLAVALAGTMTAVLMAVFFRPTEFALPSLMANLGAIEPRIRFVGRGAYGRRSVSSCCPRHNSDLAAITSPSHGDGSFRERQIVMSPLFVVRCVTKSYGQGSTAIKALDSVSLEACLGELIQVTGPSGAGKTTLLNLISALDRPDTGEILVAGANVTGLSLARAAEYRNKQVGIIFQSYNLLPQLTALE